MSKEKGFPRPWTQDPVLQTTYFCNVRREDDKVTKWIRNYYSDWVGDPDFEFNIALARLLNWPETLNAVGYRGYGDAGLALLEDQLTELSKSGKVFGDAYIVSTNGRAMPKAQYLCQMLLPQLGKALGAGSKWRATWGSASLAHAYSGLIGVYGLGSFMAGQVIADLKNTYRHPLRNAQDWWSWSTKGPGSERGLSWLNFGESGHRISEKEFREEILVIKNMLEIRYDIEELNAQDLQNCLCEFDKYCRVLMGTGKSKRKYHGF